MKKIMKKITDIAKSIYKTCYDVDRNITGLSDSDAKLWASSNSRRHAHTIIKLLDFIDLHRHKRQIRILNASGLSCGHQDFFNSDLFSASANYKY